jgi:hypothetical protein
MTKELKLAGGVPSSKLKAPPNNCIPRRAKIRMNKKSRKRSEIIDLIDANKEMTKFLSDDQYFVTLNIRSRRRARRTENPKDPPLIADHNTSKTLPVITFMNEGKRFIVRILHLNRIGLDNSQCNQNG